jgi:hypothetical protein
VLRNELSDYYRVTEEGKGSPKLLPKQYYRQPETESKPTPPTKTVPCVVASLEMAKEIFKPKDTTGEKPRSGSIPDLKKLVPTGSEKQISRVVK